MIQSNRASTGWYFLSTVVAVLGLLASTLCSTWFKALPNTLLAGYTAVVAALFIVAVTVDLLERKR